TSLILVRQFNLSIPALVESILVAIRAIR
ncbi:hypothetical protein D046_3766B, partial [Vibrio parahaemolyticus V-223/04]